MFIVIRNLSNNEVFSVERRAGSTAAQMRVIVLKEVDRVLRPNWRRGFMCNLFVSTRVGIDGQLHPLTDATLRMHTLSKVSLLAYINEKSLDILLSDRRRLAIAMAFHDRLGSDSLLGRLDAELLRCILVHT
jgi:hypothetical protein